MRRDFASRHARGVSRPPIYTPEGVRQILAMYFEALPDLRFETERIIASGRPRCYRLAYDRNAQASRVPRLSPHSRSTLNKRARTS